MFCIQRYSIGEDMFIKRFPQKFLVLLISTLLTVTSALSQGQITFSGTLGGTYTARDIGSARQAQTRSFVPRTPRMPVRILGAVGGVAFTDTAIRDGGDEIVDLNFHYDPTANDGERLQLSVNGSKLQTPPLYDWQWVPLVKFVDFPESNTVITLLDDPASGDSAEQDFYYEYFDTEFWIAFHPTLIDTVVGLNMFFVDSYFVGGEVGWFSDIEFSPPLSGYDHNLERETTQTNELRQTIASKLDNLDWDTYIYGDLLTEIRFSVDSSGTLEFKGQPGYAFYTIPISADGIEEAEAEDFFGPINARLSELDPLVFETSQNLTYWAAFFRYVRAEFPDTFRTLHDDISLGVSENGVIENLTPRVWRPFEPSN